MSPWLITQRLDRNRYGDVVDSLERSYLAYFSKLVPSIAVVSNYSCGSYRNDYQGLILSGGGDLPNRLLGGQLSQAENDLSEEKYNLQVQLFADALARRKKVLAICYGMQLVNAFLGGSVVHNVHGGSALRRPGQDHQVKLTAPASFTWDANPVLVNSYHNHGITESSLSPEMVPVAMDTDYSVVEAALHKTMPVLAIQWHPERRSPQPEFDRFLVEWFLNR